ncbi:MAG: hypothetical protein FOGNACKC_04129 [Anaerolineae bacterium]|nr:hypothetical protein [Anaerolineae bacterium]
MFWLGAGLLALYLALAGLATQLLPFSRALDEGYHLELTLFIKQTGRLPVTYEERAQMARADLPPLYHLLATLLSAGVDTTSPGQPVFKLYKDSFRYQVIDHRQDHPWSVDTEDLTYPYFGQFLVWQMGRWLSVGLSLATVLVIFLTLQEMPVGSRPLVSLAGAAMLAFLPRFLIDSAALNDDSLLGLTAAIYFWLLVKLIKAPERWWPAAALGAALGVSMTVKYSLVLMPLEIALVLGWLAYRRRLGWRWVAGRLAVIGLLAVLFSSWWFGWNIWHFNTVAQDGLITGVSRALLAGGYNATLNQIGGALGGVEVAGQPETVQIGTPGQWLQSTFTSFWGYPVDGQIPLAPGVFALIGALLLAAAVGLWRVWRSNARSRCWILLASGHVGLLVIIPLVRFATSGRIGQTAQGRHILVPAAVVVAALLVWGLAAIVPPRWRVSAFAAIIAGLIGWTGLHLFQLAQNPPPLLPMRTLTRAAGWLPQPANAQFGDSIELVSYELEPQPAQGRLNFNLAWRSLAEVKENYRLRVTLLNSGGQPVSEWLGYNGAGRLPTLAWDPGDSVFDRLALPLPNLPAGDYSAQVQMIDVNGQPLLVGGDDSALELAHFSLAESSAFNFDPTGLAVWSSAGPAVEPKFRYPGAISIVAANPGANVQLADAAGQRYSPDAAAGGVFDFIIGPRWPGGEYRLQIDGQPIGPAIAVDNWWPRTFELPSEIETPLQANFADQVYLRGYSLPQKQVRTGQAFPVTLYWQAPADKAPQANFIQFNNLLDAGGVLRGGYDRLPLENYSTLLWAPGEVVVDGYAVPVDADTPPGEVYLDVGLYLTVGEAAVNLPLVVDGQMTDVTSVTIGPVEVLAP